MLGMVLLWTLSANAQVTTADVVGTVHDSTGAVIADAKVAITNLGTGLTRTAQSGASGDFVINSLPPGAYSVKIEAPSFKTYNVSTLTLASGDRTRIDAAMQAGQTTETVEVTTATPLLQTDSSTLSSTITSQAVQDLPLNGRNFVQLAQQVPGANGGPGNGLTSGNRPDDRRQTSAISVNGQTEVINNQLIDGIDNNERIIGGLGVRPSVDTAQLMSISVMTSSMLIPTSTSQVRANLSFARTNTAAASVDRSLRTKLSSLATTRDSGRSAVNPHKYCQCRACLKSKTLETFLIGPLLGSQRLFLQQVSTPSVLDISNCIPRRTMDNSASLRRRWPGARTVPPLTFA